MTASEGDVTPLDEYCTLAYLVHEIFDSLGDYLGEKLKVDDRDVVYSARDGWYLSVSCDKAMRGDDPVTTGEALRNHPDSVGLIARPREARASLEDWIAIDGHDADVSNLTSIRSHENSICLAGFGHSFSFLPDEPMYITDQHDMAILVAVEIRALAMAYDHVTLKELRSVETAVQSFGEVGGPLQTLAALGRWLLKTVRSIALAPLALFRAKPELDRCEELAAPTPPRPDQRSVARRMVEIERLRLQTADTLEVLTSGQYSRYSDAALFMKGLLEAMGVPEVAARLNSRLNALTAAHSAFIAETERREQRRNDILVWAFSVVATPIGAIPFFELLARKYTDDVGLASEDDFTLIGTVAAGIILPIAVALWLGWFRRKA